MVGVGLRSIAGIYRDPYLPLQNNDHIIILVLLFEYINSVGKKQGFRAPRVEIEL